MKKTLETISYCNSFFCTCFGLILLIKGLFGSGTFWFIISGGVLILSGILNFIFVKAGTFHALELSVRKIIKTFKF